MPIPSVNQITSVLRGMPDKQLQQYAMLHKNDPYILSLAVQESNARKQIRAGAQMQAPQQPPVADTAIAGISALPAQNMEQMADGGIVGYADGGEVQHYQYGGSTPQMPSAGTPYGIQYLTPGATQLGVTPQAGAQEDVPFLRRLYNEQLSSINKRRVAEAAARIQQGAGSPSDFDLVNAAQMSGGAPGAAPVGPTEKDVMEAGMREREPAPTSKTGTVTKTDTGLKTDTGAGAKVDMGAGQGVKAPSVMSMYEQFAGPKNVRDTEFNQLMEEQRQLGESVTSARTRERAELEAEQKAQKPALEGYEKLLTARGERLGKEESQAGGLALLEAGLAMAAGTSSNPFENIGKGALVGTAAYRKSQEKLSEARDRMDDARAKIDEVRENRDQMNRKELRTATREINDSVTAGLQKLVEAKAKRMDIGRDEAKALFSAEVGLQGDKIRAGATLAAAQLPYQFYENLGKAAPDSALVKGFNLSKEADKIPMLYKMYTANEADPLKGGEFKARYPTFEAFLEGYQVGKGGTGGGFVQPPPNATILNPPKK